MADDLPPGTVFEFAVCDPEKVGSGAFSHWEYHIHTKVFCLDFFFFFFLKKKNNKKKSQKKKKKKKTDITIIIQTG